MQHTVKIKSIKNITPDVIQIVTEKPSGYTFIPGQATDISINKKDWENEKHPFTFTSLPKDDFIEFTIKTYPAHKGLTNEFLLLKPAEELILHDVFGDIHYKGEGVFIAGGAGVTPFIAIFRHLHSQNRIGYNKLIFANKTKADIIHEEEFKKLLGNNFINILSNENTEGYAHGFINEAFLQKHIPSGTTHFYLCAPPPMMAAIEKQLSQLHIGSQSIIKEEF